MHKFVLDLNLVVDFLQWITCICFGMQITKKRIGFYDTQLPYMYPRYFLSIWVLHTNMYI
jgi:hypothetical protein